MPAVIIDTNVFVSALLSGGMPRSIIRALEKRLFQLYLSETLLKEIEFTVHRDKFKSLIMPQEREELLAILKARAVIIPISKTITACRDPKDNFILEMALAAKANMIVTNDEDLLVLKSIEGIPIIAAREFLHKLAKAK